MRGKNGVLRWVLALISLFCLSYWSFAQDADPSPNPVLAYQGRLLEFDTPVTGTRNFVFSILAQTGKQLWTSGPQAVTVTGGLYAVVLGGPGMPPLSQSVLLRANLLLRVTVEGVQLSPDIAVMPALQASAAWNVIGPFLGDISGTQQSISVDKLKGIPIDLTISPAHGDVLSFNGTSWVASAVSQGAAGPMGPQGPQGQKGDTGEQGAQGLPGRAGPQGPTGQNGTSFTFRNAFNPGTSYVPNDVVTFQGSTYIAAGTPAVGGQPGVDPAWALMAPQGGTGPQGQQGPAGPTGAQGPQGLKGDTGATGPPGAIGLTGATGATGAQGPKGDTGSQGPIGLTGLTGPQGAPGPQGPTGQNGTSFTFRNAFNPATSYVPNDVVTFQGSTYIAAGTPAAGGQPEVDPAWALMAPQGGTGPQGQQGPAGPTGAPGPQGPPCNNGIAGNIIIYGANSSNCVDSLVPFASVLTASSPAPPLINKTFDAEGVGNTLAIPARAFFAAAGCFNGTAISNWDADAASAPAPACQGSTSQKGVLQFARGNAAYINFELPPDWNPSS